MRKTGDLPFSRSGSSRMVLRVLSYMILISALLEIKCTQDAGSVCKILKDTIMATQKQAFTATITTSSLSATDTPAESPTARASIHTDTMSSLSASGSPSQVASSVLAASDTPSDPLIAAQKQATIPTDTMSSSAVSETPADPSKTQASRPTDTTSSLSTSVITPGGPAHKQTATTSTNTVPSSATATSISSGTYYTYVVFYSTVDIL